jgi:hypothetical protein
MKYLAAFLLSLLASQACACDLKHRSKMAHCLLQKINPGGNGVTQPEMESYIAKHVGFLGRLAFSRVGGVGKIMKECDRNKDGKIDVLEFSKNSRHCLNSCLKQKMIGYYTKC